MWICCFFSIKKIPASADDLIREMIYPLWDMGIEVGHATRSVAECVTMAARDFDVFTPLLDARFICGISPLYSELVARLGKTVISKNAQRVYTLACPAQSGPAPAVRG